MVDLSSALQQEGHSGSSGPIMKLKVVTDPGGCIGTALLDTYYSSILTIFLVACGSYIISLKQCSWVSLDGCLQKSQQHLFHPSNLHLPKLKSNIKQYSCFLKINLLSTVQRVSAQTI